MPQKARFIPLARARIGVLTEARYRGKTGAVASPVPKGADNGLGQAQGRRLCLAVKAPVPPC